MICFENVQQLILLRKTWDLLVSVFSEFRVSFELDILVFSPPFVALLDNKEKTKKFQLEFSPFYCWRAFSAAVQLCKSERYMHLQLIINFVVFQKIMKLSSAYLISFDL